VRFQSGVIPLPKGGAAPQNTSPIEYDEKIALEVCDQLSRGESLTKICKKVGMPNWSTFYRWMDRYPHIKDEYERARVLCGLFHAERAINVVMDARPTNKIDLGHLRIKHDALKWYASKMAPRILGDRLQVQQGTDDDNSTKAPIIENSPDD